MTARGVRRMALSVLGLAIACGPLAAAELPKATQKILADTKLPDSILSGLDKELEMPADWLAGARKEKLLRIAGTWDAPQFNAFIKPVRER